MIELPIIQCDTREGQNPPWLRALEGRVIWERATLRTADYALAPRTTITDRNGKPFPIYDALAERKRVSDYVSCMTGDDRTRFEKELARMMGLWRDHKTKVCVVIEGDRDAVIAARRGMKEQAVVATMEEWEARFFMVDFHYFKSGERSAAWFTVNWLLSLSKAHSSIGQRAEDGQ